MLEINTHRLRQAAQRPGASLHRALLAANMRVWRIRERDAAGYFGPGFVGEAIDRDAFLRGPPWPSIVLRAKKCFEQCTPPPQRHGTTPP